MKIREVSERSGVAVATIKYYVREGLLPAGDRLSPVQTAYREEHVARLRLVRALRETGRLSIDAVRQVLRGLDTGPDGRRYAAMAMDALGDQQDDRPPRTAAEREELEEARQAIDQYLVGLGWKTPGRETSAERNLVEAFATLRRVLSKDLPVDVLEPYARAVEELAKTEIPAGRSVGAGPADALRRAFLGTILFEPILLSLRRLALGAQARRAYREEAPRTVGQRVSR